MANTRNMICLMEHAADLLANADPTADYKRLIKEVQYSEGPGYAARLASVTAAMVTAAAILRMVAAAMDDEPTAPSTPEEPA